MIRNEQQLDPECLYGKKVEGAIVSIRSLKGKPGKMVCVQGKLVSIEEQSLDNGDTNLILNISDDTGFIRFKLYTRKEDKEFAYENIKISNIYKVKGIAFYDKLICKYSLKDVLGIKDISLYPE